MEALRLAESPGLVERGAVVGVLGLVALDLLAGSSWHGGVLYVIPALVTALLATPRGAGFVALLALVGGILTLARGIIPFPLWDALSHGAAVALVCTLGILLRHARDRARRLALLDPLTGLGNHRAFFHQVEQEVARAGRYGRVFTLAYLDLDHFKAVNDRHGHQEGDAVLRTVGEVLRETLRTVDLGARLGGDEFGILLPETPLARAERALDKLRDRLDDAMAARGWPVTASVGAVTFEAPPPSADYAVRRADRLMYAAKEEARGSLVQELWTGEEEDPQRTAPPPPGGAEGAQNARNHDLFSPEGPSEAGWASSA